MSDTRDLADSVFEAKCGCVYDPSSGTWVTFHQDCTALHRDGRTGLFVWNRGPVAPVSKS